MCQDGPSQDKRYRHLGESKMRQRCPRVPWICQLLQPFYQRFYEVDFFSYSTYQKDKEFQWTPIEKTAFQAIKKAFSSAPVLLHFDPDKECTVETDASDYVSGAVFSQPDHKGILCPVAFMSRRHLPAECNYKIYNKELMAIVQAFEKWHPELEGSPKPVNVISDH